MEALAVGAGTAPLATKRHSAESLEIGDERVDRRLACAALLSRRCSPRSHVGWCGEQERRLGDGAEVRLGAVGLDVYQEFRIPVVCLIGRGRQRYPRRWCLSGLGPWFGG